MLLAEANQWPADAAAYFGEGDECHMNFHFPLMPRLFMAVELEDSFPIVNIMRQTPPVPPGCQWATFLRNHDELTLEMVTDEDRDYMYRIYASDRVARVNLGIRRRLAPLLGMRRKIELLNALLLSLPGTPVIYYGDEIGMGDNIYLGDRDGVRTPMQWSADRNAGFSRANPQRLYLPVIIDPEHHYEAINVESQQANASSLLWWMKRIIALRKQFSVFGRGDIEFLDSNNGRVLAFVRRYEKETVLVVANLSRFVQYAALDLSAFEGQTPVELFGRTRFPAVGREPYFLTLASYGFYWFQIESPEESARVGEPPALATSGSWTRVFDDRRDRRVTKALLEHVASRRWFRGKARVRKGATIADLMTVASGDRSWVLVLLTVEYEDAAPETYFVPVGFAAKDEARELVTHHHDCVIARLTVSGPEAMPAEGALYDALVHGEVPATLLQCIQGRRPIAGDAGTLSGVALKGLKEVGDIASLPPKPLSVEQSNSTIAFGDRLTMKLFRVLEDGPNCEYEIGRHLAANPEYKRSPRLGGALEYRARGRDPVTLAVVHDFVQNRGDGWQLALGALGRFFDDVLSDERTRSHPPDLAALGTPEAAALVAATTPLMSGFASHAALLGERTAELHLALARDTKDPAFTPEPFTIMYQQSLYQSAHGALARTFAHLRRTSGSMPEPRRALVDEMIGLRAKIDMRLREMAHRRLVLSRIRCHGDYHLGQVLWTGEDFLVVDFEGEPARPAVERRYKRSAIRDVAGMVRSFDYASATALRHGRMRPDDIEVLEPWARLWTAVVREAFVGAWLAKVAGQPFVPARRGDAAFMLDFYVLEKCIYEIGYELHNRPDWLDIPLRGLLDLARAPRASSEP
jgi:maltose alpha-D-glucosyltransferase/alpha-amylase